MQARTFETEIAAIRGRDDASTLRVHGRVRYPEAPELRRRLLRWIDETPARRLVVSLGEVADIDTSGAAVLVEALLRGRERGKPVLLCSPSPSVMRMFRLAGFEEALDACCPTPAETARRLMT
ncbi:MAG TPA: STAS domain-containing protein [Candidatus Polarisedimenticolaceae bacterium]|nr:STAS domain-containing protein [Candidatus Polarisedimenticolaceae bacterium]